MKVTLSDIRTGLDDLTVKLETYKPWKRESARNIYSNLQKELIELATHGNFSVVIVTLDKGLPISIHHRLTILYYLNHQTTFSMYLCLHRRWSSTQKQSIRKTYQKQKELDAMTKSL
jgi:hypothetical protein